MILIFEVYSHTLYNENSVNPDQLASNAPNEANWSGPTLFNDQSFCSFDNGFKLRRYLCKNQAFTFVSGAQKNLHIVPV